MSPRFDVQAIVHGDAEQLAALFSAAIASSGTAALRANTAEKLFTYFCKGDQFDKALTPLLLDLQPAFMQRVAQDDTFYCNPTHPLRLFLNSLMARAKTWYPRDSKPNQVYFDKLAELIQFAVRWCNESPTSASADALTNTVNEFQQWSVSEDKRSAMLEARLCEAELNHLKMLTAECRVLDVMNAALSNRHLPIELIELIPTTLKAELQHCAFTAGIGSNFWKIWQRLLPPLGKIFCPDEEIDEQRLYRDIPIMLNELDRSTQMNPSNPGAYHHFIEVLGQTLAKRIQHLPQECGLLSPLPYPDGHSDLTTRVTDAVLRQAAAIQQGDWILFTIENGQLIRCKLALKNAEADQLLFVDNTGRKVMIKSSKDFSMCLSTGIATFLPVINIDEAIAKLIQALIKLSTQKPSATPKVSTPAAEPTTPLEDSSTQAAEKNPAQEVAPMRNESPSETAQEKQREESRLQAEQEAALRRAAAHKALAEARAIAEEKARRAEELTRALEAERKQLEEQQQLASRQAEQLMRMQVAQQHINSLNVGAWIEINKENDEKIRCKLAVIIGSAGKYIFVDNLGRKVAEYQRDDLIQAHLENTISLINNGDKFEDQLAKVIRGLRKDVQ